MPQDYDLNIDGKSYNLKWDKPVPPTQADIEGIVSQYRAQAKQPAPDPAAPQADPNLLASGVMGGTSGAQPDYRTITRDPVYEAPSNPGAMGAAPTYRDPATGERTGSGPINVYDKFRMDFFNDTEDPSIPLLTARALAKDPNSPGWNRRLARMSPVAQVAIRDKAQELADAPIYEAPTNPGAMGAAPVYRDPHTGERTAIPLPHDIIGTMIHGEEGYEQLKKAKGAGAAAIQMAEGVLDPESLAMLLGGGMVGALGKISALGTLGKAATLGGKIGVTGGDIVAGTFAALGAKQAADAAKEGDYGKAAFNLAVGVAPLVTHAKVGSLGRAAEAIPTVTDISDPGLTRGSTQAPAPETVSGLSGKVKVKKPFDVAPDVLNQISEHNANVDKEKANATSGKTETPVVTSTGIRDVQSAENRPASGVQPEVSVLPTANKQGVSAPVARNTGREEVPVESASVSQVDRNQSSPNSDAHFTAPEFSSLKEDTTGTQTTKEMRGVLGNKPIAEFTDAELNDLSRFVRYQANIRTDGTVNGNDVPWWNLLSEVNTALKNRRPALNGESHFTAPNGETLRIDSMDANNVLATDAQGKQHKFSTSEVEAWTSKQFKTEGEQHVPSGNPQISPSAETGGSLSSSGARQESGLDIRGTQELPAASTGEELPSGNRQTVPGTAPPTEPVGTKLANAHVLAERRAQGLPDFPTESTDSRAQAYEKAFASAAPETALSVADEVRKSPRAMTLQELVDNSLKHREVKTDIADVTNQIKRGVEAGRDTSDLQAKYDSLVADKHALTDASYLSGTDQSHAFAFRQHILDDYTPEDLQKRLEMARPEVAPTPKEVKAINDIAEKHAVVEKALTLPPDEADSLMAGQKVVEQIQAEQNKQSRRAQRAASKADLDAEYEDLIKQWVKKSTGQANAGIPIDPEGLRILRDMAKNRVKAGALTVSDVVDHLHEAVTQTIPDATKRQVRDWWTGYGQGSKIPGATTLGDLKEQARWMSKIEDVNDPLPKSAPRAVSEAVAKLKEEYKAAKAEAEGAKSPEEIEQARVEKRIEGLKKTLAGNVEATPRLTTVDTEKMSGMRKELKSLQEDLTDRKKKAGPSPPSPEQLTQVRMQRRIDLIEEKIRTGKVLPEKKPQLSTVDTESMAATRKQLEAAEARLKALQKAARPATAKADPLEAYRAKLSDQIADMQKNIDAGTPENIKKATVQKRAYDEQTTKLIEQRQRLRKQAEAIIESRKTKSRLEKFSRYHRFVILTRASTLGKLGAAATERLIFDPVEDAAGGALAVVPGYRKLSNMAPNGRGSLKATGKAVSTAFSRQAIREARQKLQTGMNSKDALHGDIRDHLEQPALHNLPGRIHGAIKTPIQLAAYEKSIVKQSAWAERNGFDLNKPDVKAAVEARAYLESKRAILMQENTATSIYRFVENGLEKNEKLGKSGKLMASAMRTAFPIVAVPTNFVGEVGLHAAGAGRAAWEVAAAKGVQNLTPEQADIVVRSLKKQSVGAALFAIGYYNANNFGGYYAKGGNKHNDLETGSVKVHLFGTDHEIPHVFLHSPQMEVMTMGAAFRQAMDNWRQGKSSETQIGDSAGTVVKGLAEQVPFVDMPQRFFRASESPKATSVFAGQTVGGALVPGLLPDVASGLDKDSRGRTKKRTPQGFMDAMKMSVGARQSVPESRR